MDEEYRARVHEIYERRADLLTQIDKLQDEETDLFNELVQLKCKRFESLIGRYFLYGNAYYKVLEVPEIDSTLVPVLYVDPDRGEILYRDIDTNHINLDQDIIEAMPGREVTENEFKCGILLLLNKYKDYS